MSLSGATGSSSIFFQYAVETDDRSLYEDFVALNALHANFYDEIIPADAFPFFYQKAIEYLAHLKRLAEGSGNT
jgi:hypothetical protein